ncbi:hypothetical protein [Roseiconus lacunae]|uniref:Uncharacterized protein n=1 Tax=Roseiconus lacunae TaxID=2605694 RepID=A0ABT7PHJ6_9BACT|nr:hypothetical protein [Roseiconus lacunae]MDM4015974.1 hypothetical protein [Roseiconus lacunae]
METTIDARDGVTLGSPEWSERKRADWNDPAVREVLRREARAIYNAAPSNERMMRDLRTLSRTYRVGLHHLTREVGTAIRTPIAHATRRRVAATTPRRRHSGAHWQTDFARAREARRKRHDTTEPENAIAARFAAMAKSIRHLVIANAARMIGRAA